MSRRLSDITTGRTLLAASAAGLAVFATAAGAQEPPATDPAIGSSAAADLSAFQEVVAWTEPSDPANPASPRVLLRRFAGETERMPVDPGLTDLDLGPATDGQVEAIYIRSVGSRQTVHRLRLASRQESTVPIAKPRGCFTGTVSIWKEDIAFIRRGRRCRTRGIWLLTRRGRLVRLSKTTAADVDLRSNRVAIAGEQRVARVTVLSTSRRSTPIFRDAGTRPRVTSVVLAARFVYWSSTHGTTRGRLYRARPLGGGACEADSRTGPATTIAVDSDLVFYALPTGIFEALAPAPAFAVVNGFTPGSPAERGLGPGCGA